MTYDYYIDEKVTIWRRNKYRVSCSEEQAKNIAIAEFDVPGYDEEEVGFIESEFIYESEEIMEVGDNGGQATKELYFEEELIKTNL